MKMFDKIVIEQAECGARNFSRCVTFCLSCLLQWKHVPFWWHYTAM